MRPKQTAIKRDILEWLIYQPYRVKTSWQFYRYRDQYTPSQRSNKVVVSLTSFPARFGKLHNCLKALIGQKVKPDRLVLYLSSEECKGHSLPETITTLQKYGLEIRYTEQNHRSFNKIVHALKDFPSDILVTCDDDKLYPSDWLQKLLVGHDAHPEHVVCLRSRMIARDHEGQLLPYRDWPAGKSGIPCHTTLPLGVGGVLYPPQCFTKDVLNTDLFEELCPSADDLWLKFLGMQNNRKAVQLGDSPERHASIPFWDGQKLSVGNIWGNQNDVSLQRLIRHFGTPPDKMTKEGPG
ncbi:MAG: glycosyltransferase family A protein, partial [Anderseniella sp.]